MTRAIGIDLGTTNSVICVAAGQDVRLLPDAEGNVLIPSAVSFHPAGDVLVGHAARERRLIDAPNTVYSVKRLIGRPFASPEVQRARGRFGFELVESPTGGTLVRVRGGSYTLPEISAFVLRELKNVAGQRLGEEVGRAVITVPANFNELQRSATKAAGRVAGLEVLRILNEPTAAALAYGFGKGNRERVAVFDLGGGTFDITILELAGQVFEVLSTAGDTFLGGDDVDHVLADRMAQSFLDLHRFDPRTDAQAFERLRAAAEWAKCQLSQEDEVQLRIEELAYGDGGLPLDLTFGMTREGLEGLTRPLLGRAFEVCEQAMETAGIRPTQLDSVILVGGSTRIPLVRRMVEEYFGRPALATIDPDIVVARGAAFQAAVLGAAPAPKSSRAIGRVALARVSQDELERRRARKRALAKEAAEARPAGPAFAPARPQVKEELAPAQGWDEAPTRVAEAHASPDETPPSSSTPAAPSTSSAPPPPAPSSSNRPARARSVPPPPPSSRRRSAVPPRGGQTLGFGSEGLPVPDFSAMPEPASPSAPPPASPSVPPPPPAAASRPPAFASQPPARPSVPPPAPLLLDVTPLTLGVETVSGFCEAVIPKNSAIPVEQSRVFGTGVDDQSAVSVRIYQGESRRFAENQPLGDFELTGLRKASRGALSIEVNFVMDADGILGVSARDQETGAAQQVRIRLVGGIDEDEIRRMAERQAQLMGE